MKRAILGLATGALVLAGGSTAGAAQEPPKPHTYTLWCGDTLVYACGTCVALGEKTLYCVYY